MHSSLHPTEWKVFVLQKTYKVHKVARDFGAIQRYEALIVFFFFFVHVSQFCHNYNKKATKKILPVHSSLCSSLASFKVLWPLLIFECCLQVVQGNKSFELCVSVCVCAVPMYLTLASAKSKFSWELWEESSFLLTPYCYEMTFEIISSWSYQRGV